jgi:hypothetical protein
MQEHNRCINCILCLQVTGSTPLWFKYQNRDAIHIDTEVSGTYDLRCLDPDTFNYVLLQLNGRGGLVESDGRTKHVLDGLKFRFPQRYGDTQDTAIHVTLPGMSAGQTLLLILQLLPGAFLPRITGNKRKT